MNNDQQKASDAALNIVEDVSDEIVLYCVKQFRDAVESAKLDESLCYEVLQNMLARVVAKVLVVCFGSSPQNSMHYTSDFVNVVKYHIESELADQEVIH